MINKSYLDEKQNLQRTWVEHRKLWRMGCGTRIQKSIKKNEVNIGRRLGIDFVSMLVDFWTQLGRQNPSKFALFYHKKTRIVVFNFYFVQLYFSPMNVRPGLCQHRPGHSLGKKIKSHKMKNGKSNFGFSFHKNIANFEAFL